MTAAELCGDCPELLPELHRLNLDNNQISYLTNETFAFKREESKLLLIFLRYNNLTATSFEGYAPIQHSSFPRLRRCFGSVRPSPWA